MLAEIPMKRSVPNGSEPVWEREYYEPLSFEDRKKCHRLFWNFVQVHSPSHMTLL